MCWLGSYREGKVDFLRDGGIAVFLHIFVSLEVSFSVTTVSSSSGIKQWKMSVGRRRYLL